MHKILKLEGVVNLYVPENKELKLDISIDLSHKSVLSGKESVKIICVSRSFDDSSISTTPSRKNLNEENPD